MSADPPLSDLMKHVISELRERLVDNETMARDAAEETFRAIESGGHKIVPVRPAAECICPKCGVRHGLQTEASDELQF